MKACSILVVDDNEADRYILKRLIKSAEITDKIYEKINGKEAIEFLSDYEVNKQHDPEGFPPVLIFLDVNMPIMNGFEFLSEFKKLREQHDYESCVLIMSTSSERSDERERALSYDFVKGYIHKMPNSSEELRAQVEQYL